MSYLSKKNFFIIILLTYIITLLSYANTAIAAQPQVAYDMRQAFNARDWRTMDALYERFASDDISPGSNSAGLSTQELSLYVNALWRQGRYEKGVAVLGSIQQDFPDELLPYAKMLFILGAERTGRKAEAFEAGSELWRDAPTPIKYYLAYAMGRLARDLSKPDDSLLWFRKMLEYANDKKRSVQALSQMITLNGVSLDEAASLLIASPSNAGALLFLSTAPAGSSSRAEYALGYNSYIRGRYDSAISHFKLASADIEYGEAARYYYAYSAYRQKHDDLAYTLWSEIALKGNDYPQRSVQRLQSMASRGKKDDIVELLGRVSDAREKDYPEVAADALVSITRLSEGRTADDAMKKLFSTHAATTQAATLRWEKGWEAWKSRKYKIAMDQWSAGYTPELKNTELASRLLYWNMKALEKLKSPVAALRIRKKLVEDYPAEYYTFLVSADGGIRSNGIPESFITSNDLEEWGFVTYARLEGANMPGDATSSPDIPSLYRAVRLALWEEDFSSAARACATLQRLISKDERASSELLKNSYPRAFEREVLAASKKTGVDPAVIWGIMRQESMYEPDVTSSAGAYGLMQLMPATARSEAAKLKMAADSYLQPPNNILLGANHIAGLIARFDDPPRALAAYNAGGTPVTRWSKDPIANMDEWVEDIGYRETRGYVKAVLRNIAVYQILYP
ncbi:MAG: lytic transglycosylase domain-containing protein [Synergistaceae bacterium]|jgi:soluble lytic murein transglycosylase|nr:lytic transglycosylase domain-containing protein [Synergistaceae bacterium]